MATAMLENGADIRFIQEMLGHAKLTSTQVYTRVSIAKLKAVHTAAIPRRCRSEGARGAIGTRLPARRPTWRTRGRRSRVGRAPWRVAMATVGRRK